MGLLRKTAYLGTGGIIAPHSRKQRTQLKTLAAIQGASPAQVRRTGGRYDFDSVVTGTPEVRQPAPSPRPKASRKVAPEQPDQQAANEAYEANRPVNRQARAEAEARRAEAEARKAEADQARAEAEARTAMSEALKAASAARTAEAAAQVQAAHSRAEAEARKAERRQARKASAKAAWRKFTAPQPPDLRDLTK